MVAVCWVNKYHYVIYIYILRIGDCLSDYVLVLGSEVDNFGNDVTRVAASAWQFFILVLQWVLSQKGECHTLWLWILECWIMWYCTMVRSLHSIRIYIMDIYIYVYISIYYGILWYIIGIYWYMIYYQCWVYIDRYMIYYQWCVYIYIYYIITTVLREGDVPKMQATCSRCFWEGPWKCKLTFCKYFEDPPHKNDTWGTFSDQFYI